MIWITDTFTHVHTPINVLEAEVLKRVTSENPQFRKVKKESGKVICVDTFFHGKMNECSCGWMGESNVYQVILHIES